MLDRVNARANGPLCSFGSVRMRCGFQAQGVRFVNQRVELGLRELGRIHRVRE